MIYNFNKCEFIVNPLGSAWCMTHQSYKSGPSGICQESIAEYQREHWSAQHYAKCGQCGSTEYQYMPFRCAKCGAGGAPEDRGWQWMVGDEDQVDQV